MRYRWICLRCGKCCINIVNDAILGKIGMFLLPHEVGLFPRKIVRPLYGVGLKGRSRPRPEVVTGYQMIQAPCPYYNVDKPECKRYASRPAICRSYPIIGSAFTPCISATCTAVDKFLPDVSKIGLRDIEGFKSNLLAACVLMENWANIYLRNVYCVDTSVSWFYNFETEKWTQITLEKSIEILSRLGRKVNENA